MLIVYILLLFLLVAACMGLVAYADNGYSAGEFIAGCIGFIGLLAAAAAAFAGLCLAYQWYAAEQKAAILNREYDVKYTQAEIFYASDVVDVIRELDRKRIEINGDFRRQRDPERNLPVRQQDNRQ
ncbi:MAG: hypothetical protein RR877_10060 [Aurantimicrobium sp.]|uniref:hypothetical protein n=1 Tax=Aurantimicrobium sp. TaxID=1930784 RepID=UPI002FCBB53D